VKYPSTNVYRVLEGTLHIAICLTLVLKGLVLVTIHWVTQRRHLNTSFVNTQIINLKRKRNEQNMLYRFRFHLSCRNWKRSKKPQKQIWKQKSPKTNIERIQANVTETYKHDGGIISWYVDRKTDINKFVR
jgi:hypothetical protein